MACADQGAAESASGAVYELLHGEVGGKRLSHDRAIRGAVPDRPGRLEALEVRHRAAGGGLQRSERQDVLLPSEDDQGRRRGDELVTRAEGRDLTDRD